MKKRLVIHIGIHKTGSTAIQQTLADNTGQLSQHGILYPRHYAARAGAINHNLLVWEIEASKVDFVQLRNWAQSLAQTDAHTVIISAEDLCRLKSLEFLSCFSDFFEAEVVIYLRRQDSWVISWYNQHIKWPYVTKLARCTPTEFLGYLGDFHWINYFDTIERWADAVGRNNMHIRVLEKGQIQDPVADICDICGVDFLLEKTIATRINESLPPAQIRILRDLGIMQYSPNIRLAIMEAVQKVPVVSGSEIYPKEIRRMILNRYMSSNAKVAEYYLGRKDRVLFRDNKIPDRAVDRGKYTDEEQLFSFARGLIDTFCAKNNIGASRTDAD